MRKPQWIRAISLLTGLMLWAQSACATPPSCQSVAVGLQVLGSGGPELNDNRASSGYLLWRDGKALVLVDVGPGSLLRYDQSGARLEDLEIILLSHLHVDHTGDLPALIKGAYFTDRQRDLPLYGPDGNAGYPSTRDFVRALFGSENGAFRYLGGYLSGDESFRLVAHDVSAAGQQPVTVVNDRRFRITAIPVHHGPVPALAWRVDVAGRSVIFSGDMNGDRHTLEGLATNADLLVADHAIPESATGAARELHMPPSVIGKIAATAKVKQVLLSHRMNRSLGRETESLQSVRKDYRNAVLFAEDGQCIPL